MTGMRFTISRLTISRLPALLSSRSLTCCHSRYFESNFALQRWKEGLHRHIHTSVYKFASSTGNEDQNRNKENRENDHEDDEKRRRSTMIVSAMIWIGLTAGFLISTWIRMAIGADDDDQHLDSRQGMKTLSWDEFVKDYLRHGKVEKILTSNMTPERAANLNLKTFQIIATLKQPKSTGGAHANPLSRAPLIQVVVNRDTFFNLEQAVREAEIQYNIPLSESVSVEFGNYQSAVRKVQLLWFAVALGILYWLFRKVRVSMDINPFNSMMKSYTRGDSPGSTTPQIKFSDIAGLKQAKIEIQEYVSYLKHPERFQKLGAQIPKGALLLGPPGCGKTLLAKAVATESRVPFLVMAGSEFDEVIGGVGAGRVRKLFEDARSLKPCIIYIDEIDAIGRKRSESGAQQGGGESEHTLNQLLAEMDGMTSNSGVITLASTNRADVLDKALKRPGRFDRHIDIELPTLSERKELFSLYMKKLTIEKLEESEVSTLAQSTPGMSGADIANICNEAALYAARQAHSSVTPQDFQFALSRVIAGQAKLNTTLSPSERKTVAYHECGHVITSWMQEHPNALLKVSIIPRTQGALGFAQYVPEDKKFYSKEELFQQMVVMLGGRAAEAVFFNRITTGAVDDLDKVSQLAKNQVKTFGMSDAVGLLSFTDSGEYQSKPYSKSLQRIIDQETSQLVSRAYQTAERIVSQNQSKLDALAKLLLEKEEMTYDDVKQTIGIPPYGNKKLI